MDFALTIAVENLQSWGAAGAAGRQVGRDIWLSRRWSMKAVFPQHALWVYSWAGAMLKPEPCGAHKAVESSRSKWLFTIAYCTIPVSPVYKNCMGL